MEKVFQVLKENIMRSKYIEKRFNASSLRVIQRGNSIIEEFRRDDMRLTLRQLFYQFVSRDLFEKKYSYHEPTKKWYPEGHTLYNPDQGTINCPNNYKMLGNVVNDARLAGLMDWDAIEDRTRNLQTAAWWSTPMQLLDVAADGFKRNLWGSQPYYVEVWVEKEALAGVIERACDKLRLNFMACRGYMSQSEQREAGARIAQKIRQGKKVLVLHLGDHDPSGIDMTRDNDERLRMFIYAEVGEKVISNFEFRRLALTMTQIEQYNPPPNNAKETDSRFQQYEADYGDQSWELDALSPRVVKKLIEDNVKPIIDEMEWKVAIDKEKIERA